MPSRIPRGRLLGLLLEHRVEHRPARWAPQVSGPVPCEREAAGAEQWAPFGGERGHAQGDCFGPAKWDSAQSAGL
jgi:hypothetical protein